MKRLNLILVLCLGAVVIAAAAIVFALPGANRIAGAGAGYKAKVACSEIFLAGRDAETVIANEFNDIDPMLDLIGLSIDETAETARAAGPLGVGSRRAVYRDGYGCTLAIGGAPASLPPAPPPAPRTPLPVAAASPAKEAVDAAIRAALADPAGGHRAVLVLKDGALLGEGYADGFSADTPMLSWSMAKSITATLVGAALGEGRLDLDDPAPVPEWDGDPDRSAIAWRDLLQMQSGLAFGEDYGDPTSDVNRMLFSSRDVGAALAGKPLIHPPGTYWAYSSGTTNLLSRTLKQTLEAQGVDYHAFGRERIFDPLGAASVVMEPDASGVFIGSSYVYATARDWARLGQLYLQDGIWDGARLLPAGWADFVRAPAAASDGQYGGHFWLNRDGAGDRPRFAPGLPEDAYFMAGHEGQYVFILPSDGLVIVRLGMTRGRDPMPAAAPLLGALYAAAQE